MPWSCLLLLSSVDIISTVLLFELFSDRLISSTVNTNVLVFTVRTREKLQDITLKHCTFKFSRFRFRMEPVRVVMVGYKIIKLSKPLLLPQRVMKGMRDAASLPFYFLQTIGVCSLIADSIAFLD